MLAVSLPPLLPRGTLRARPGLPATVAARGVFGASFACVEMFIPLVLQDESGLSPTLTGLVMMTGALGWVTGSTYTGRHAVRERYGAILRLGALSLVVGTGMSLAMVPLEAQPWLASAVATVGFTVMGLGMGLVTPLLSTLALDLAEPGRQGESGAAIQMSDALGQSVAAGLVGALFASWYVVDPDTSYFSGLGLAVLLAVGAVAIVGRRGRLEAGAALAGRGVAHDLALVVGGVAQRGLEVGHLLLQVGVGSPPGCVRRAGRRCARCRRPPWPRAPRQASARWRAGSPCRRGTSAPPAPR